MATKNDGIAIIYKQPGPVAKNATVFINGEEVHPYSIKINSECGEMTTVWMEFWVQEIDIEQQNIDKHCFHIMKKEHKS